MGILEISNLRDSVAVASEVYIPDLNSLRLSWVTPGCCLKQEKQEKRQNI